MQSTHHVFVGLAALKRALGVVSFLAVCFLAGPATPQATERPPSDSQRFEATFSGSFGVVGDDERAVLFLVAESGKGEQTSKPTSRTFTYAASVLQNLARIPRGCGPNSSTGVDGFAVLTFVDGQIVLKRISGSACFAFPTIHVEERWRIVSGTGAYVGAEGKLSRQLDGDVRFGTVAGTMSGSIDFDDE